jgi:hypothetical protein
VSMNPPRTRTRMTCSSGDPVVVQDSFAGGREHLLFSALVVLFDTV